MKTDSPVKIADRNLPSRMEIAFASERERPIRDIGDAADEAWADRDLDEEDSMERDRR